MLTYKSVSYINYQTVQFFIWNKNHTLHVTALKYSLRNFSVITYMLEITMNYTNDVRNFDCK